MQALSGLRCVLPSPPPTAFVKSLSESTVDIEFNAWIDQREANFFRMRSEAIRVVKAALDGLFGLALGLALIPIATRVIAPAIARATDR